MTDTAASILDVTEATFSDAVIAASHSRPVVVDFWAGWCGPCHQLSPLLQRVAARYADDVAVVKLDVDTAPNLSRRYGIQGIPAVKAFRNGQVVAEFVGVQPEAAITRFFQALAPTAADRLVAQAAAAGADREALLREALASQPDHPGAATALAALLAERGDVAEAAALLERVPGDAGARRLLAELRLGADPAAGDLDDLRRRAEAGDAGARVALGRALASRGDTAAALPVLLDAVRDPRTRGEARETMLEVFTVLGDDSDLVRAWRPKLASALF